MKKQEYRVRLTYQTYIEVDVLAIDQEEARASAMNIVDAMTDEEYSKEIVKNLSSTSVVAVPVIN